MKKSKGLKSLRNKAARLKEKAAFSKCGADYAFYMDQLSKVNTEIYRLEHNEIEQYF